MVNRGNQVRTYAGADYGRSYPHTDPPKQLIRGMETPAAKAFASVVMARIDTELYETYQMWKTIKRESRFLKEELLLLAAFVDDQEKATPRTAVAIVYGEEIRELTHDIEDCIERFLPRITCKAGASWAHRCAHAIRTCCTRLQFASKIKNFKNRVGEARQRALNAAAASGAQPSNNETVQQVRYAQDYCSPVGITDATRELLALLDIDPKANEADGTSNTSTATQLRVVAIVGFGGSGKTTLAKAVYDIVRKEPAFRCAWVDGHSLDRKDANGIVKHIQDELHLGEECSSAKNRYLIVIDDIKDKHLMHWDTLINAFRDNGRIIVTTTTRSIANSCCNHPREDDRRTFGRVYNMRSLGKKDSEKIALRGRSPPGLVEGAEELLKKCGGLPLALYSVAGRLRRENDFTGTFCNIMCNDLGRYLGGEIDDSNFARLRGVLRENYTSLSDYNVRTCMLYLGIFPMDHPLKKNVIIRRWLAEGYARHPEGMDQSLAEENFNTFMKRNIILPVAPESNAIGKTCKTHSIMHVFMLHKSMSKKFIMPFGSQHKKVRHFFIHDRSCANSVTVMPGIDLSRVRSLTVLGHAGDAISNFSKYKLTRVLDLEGCTDLNDGHLKHICKLWNLRYLSLGPNITKIPKKIAQLKLLETLDVSKTRVDVLMLPVEAIVLPCLIHLVGKFKLEGPVMTERLPKQCMLETVAGFVAAKGQGFLQLMDRMKKLNKLKIWCECEKTEQGQVDMNKHLFEVIQKYIEIPIGKEKFRSLSLNFQALPRGTLSALDQLCKHYSSEAEHLYFLSSLKLHGNLSSGTLSNFIALFRDLARLSLSTPMSMTQHLLSVIGEMARLSSLKIIANSIDDFVLQDGKFMSLERLCLVLKVVGPSVLTIEDGGGREIKSLQLICKNLVGFSGIEITRLHYLEEIALHPGVSENTKEKWEAQARKHHNRPCVLYIPGDLEETSSSQEATNNTLCLEEIAHEDHSREEPAQEGDTQEEPAAVDKEPAHEDSIREEPAVVEKKPRHKDHTREEPAAVNKEESVAFEKESPHENQSREEPVAIEQKPAQEDETQEEPDEVEKQPAHEAHIREEPAAVEKKLIHEDHIRQEAAAVEEDSAQEDHTQREPAAVEEIPSACSAVCKAVEPDNNATDAVKFDLVVSFPSSIEFHVNGVQEGGDKEALVLGVAQLQKVALR